MFHSLLLRLRRTRIYKPGEASPRRADWERLEAARPRERAGVRGLNRRIVIVPSPDPKVFEQAIFVVREDYLRESERKGGELLREAQDVAEDYLRDALGPAPRRRLWPLVILAAALVSVGLYLGFYIM